MFVCVIKECKTDDINIGKICSFVGTNTSYTQIHHKRHLHRIHKNVKVPTFFLLSSFFSIFLSFLPLHLNIYIFFKHVYKYTFFLDKNYLLTTHRCL